MRRLSLKIFKTAHQLISYFMSIISEIKSSNRPICNQQNLNLKVVKANQVKIGQKSLRVLGTDYHHMLKMLKTFLLLSDWEKKREGVLCKCNLCKKI